MLFAEGFSVSDETGARLVQILMAFCASQTLRVPLQIRRNPQDKPIQDLMPATHAKRSHLISFEEKKSLIMFVFYFANSLLQTNLTNYELTFLDIFHVKKPMQLCLNLLN